MATNKVVSIDIGNSFTRVAEVDYKKKNPSVYNCFSIRTPEGAVDDGQIVEASELADEIRRGMAENGISTKKVVFSITSSKIANREVTVPRVKDKSLSGLINAKAVELFPMDMSQYQLAYTQLDEVDVQGSKQLRILMLAASKELLESYYTLAKEADLSIEALDYSGNSIMPVIQSEVTDEVTLVIKVDEASSLLTVLDKKTVALQRNITYGADAAIEEVMTADALGATPYDDAVKLLRSQRLIGINGDGEDDEEAEAPDESSLAASLGFDKEEEPEEEEEEEEKPKRRKRKTKKELEAEDRDLRRKQLVENVTESLDMLLGSITRVIDYYNSRNTERPIEKCILTGMGGDFRGLDLLLAEETGLEVVGLKNISSAKLLKTVKKVSVGEYITCIGAAIDPLDLIPPEHDKKKAAAIQRSTQKSKGLSLSGTNTVVLGWVLVAVGVAACGVLVVLSLLPYMSAKKKYEDLNSQLNALMPIVEVYNEYMDTTALYTEVDNLYQITNTRNEGLYDFIAELEEKLPSRTIVTAFSSDGTAANMSFKCGSKEDAVNLINCLRTFESVASINVAAINDNIDRETLLSDVTFSVTCTYRTPEPVSLNEVGQHTSSFSEADVFGETDGLEFADEGEEGEENAEDAGEVEE